MISKVGKYFLKFTAIIVIAMFLEWLAYIITNMHASMFGIDPTLVKYFLGKEFSILAFNALIIFIALEFIAILLALTIYFKKIDRRELSLNISQALNKYPYILSKAIPSIYADGYRKLRSVKVIVLFFLLLLTVARFVITVNYVDTQGHQDSLYMDAQEYILFEASILTVYYFIIAYFILSRIYKSLTKTIYEDSIINSEAYKRAEEKSIKEHTEKVRRDKIRAAENAKRDRIRTAEKAKRDRIRTAEKAKRDRIRTAEKAKVDKFKIANKECINRIESTRKKADEVISALQMVTTADYLSAEEKEAYLKHINESNQLYQQYLTQNTDVFFRLNLAQVKEQLNQICTAVYKDNKEIDGHKLTKLHTQFTNLTQHQYWQYTTNFEEEKNSLHNLFNELIKLDKKEELEKKLANLSPIKDMKITQSKTLEELLEQADLQSVETIDFILTELKTNSSIFEKELARLEAENDVMKQFGE